MSPTPNAPPPSHRRDSTPAARSSESPSASERGRNTRTPDASRPWTFSAGASSDATTHVGGSPAVRASFETWSEVSCSSLRIAYRGATDDRRVGFDGQNVVLFRAANAAFLGLFAAGFAAHLARRRALSPALSALVVAIGCTAVPLLSVVTVLFAEPLFLVLALGAWWLADAAAGAARLLGCRTSSPRTTRRRR